MLPDEFDENMERLGFTLRTEDYPDGTSVDFWFKYCPRCPAGHRTTRYLMGRSIRYQPSLLEMRWRTYSGEDCGHNE